MYPTLFRIFNYDVASWSFMVVLGVLLLAYLYIRRLRQLGTTEKTIDRLVLVTAVAGIFVYFGASFFDTLWHAIEAYHETGVFSFTDEFGELVGGVTFEGGIISGLIFFFILFPFGMKQDKKQALFYSDQLVTFILLAHSLGRIGCYLAGCCYGKSTSSILGLLYPTDYGWMKVYPTQLIEAIFLFVAFLIFFLFIKKNQTEKYLFVYGIYRFFAEYLRGDDRGSVFGGFISPSQFLSIVMVIMGIAAIIMRKKIFNNPNNDYTKIKDTLNEETDYNTTKLSKPVINYYQELEQTNFKTDFKDYFRIPEYVICGIILLIAVVSLTSDKQAEKYMKNSYQEIETYVSENTTYEIVNAQLIYVASDPHNKDNNSNVFVKVMVTSTDKNPFLCYSYNIESEEISVITDSDFAKIKDLLKETDSKVKYININ